MNRKEYFKNYNKLNKEKISKRMKGYYLDNKERILKRTKTYRLSHRKELRVYHNNRRKIDIEHKIICNLRSRLNKALKGFNKLETTTKLIGCSTYQLKKYLESQFKPGMSWNNYGSWHIDHIKPCANFDMTKATEQKKCFNYTNLQPLWALDNIKKSNKI